MGRVGSRAGVVVEGLVVALAVGGATCSASAACTRRARPARVAGFDPLIAAVPVLVGIAAGHRRRPAVPDRPARRAAVARRRGAGLVAHARGPPGDRGRRDARPCCSSCSRPRPSPPSPRSRSTASTRAPTRRRGSRSAAATASRRRTAALPANLDAAALPGVDGRRPACSRASRRSAAARAQALFASSIAGPMATALAGTPADPQFPPRLHDARGRARSRPSSRRSSREAPRGVKLGETFQTSVAGVQRSSTASRRFATGSRGCRAVGPGSWRRASGSWPRPPRRGCADLDHRRRARDGPGRPAGGRERDVPAA